MSFRGSSPKTFEDGDAAVSENRPGGFNNIGTEAVARAEPDGYTLLAAPPTPLVVNQHLYSKLALTPPHSCR
jgi:tripartite-type tricarboxylate transporter receptor subunit TctC